MTLSKKRQLEEIAAEWDIPIIFVEDIENHNNLIILPRSDGKQNHIWVDLKPIVQNENMIKVNHKLKNTLHNVRNEPTQSPQLNILKPSE